MLTYPQLAADKGITSEIDSVGFPAVLKYLRDRGIEGDLIDALGLRIFPASEVIGRARGTSAIDDRLAVIFPHFNVKGEYIDWWSSRLVDCGIRRVVSFNNLVPHKRGKMFCPPNEAPHAYLVPTLDWTKLSDGDKVYIHESCIKAVNGARLGYFSVGLNGVWGWTSKKNGIGLVQELRDLPWKSKKLQPVIVFDSNAEDNWDVQAAISRLAAKLLEVTGQHATHLLLPRAGDGSHQGFDDYVVRAGADVASAFLEQDGTPVQISGVEILKLQLNEEVCVVRSLGRIAEQVTGTLMSRGVFTDINYAHYMAQVESKDDVKMVNVPKLWLADTRRVEVEGITYAPGKDRIIDGNLNIWRGMGLEPAAGDPSPWLALFDRVQLPEDQRKWLIQWMAYPLQHLGTKLTTYAMLFGPPGTGKQAILAPLMKIYGNNAIIIGKREIASDFNSIYANKQFINVDEIHGGADSDATKVGNKVKYLTTQDKLVVNTKGQPEYEVPNCGNIALTANYSDALRLDDDDRRAFVVQWGIRGQGEDKDFWTQYHKWLDDGGAAMVYSYLMSVDLTDFNPKGWAPMTDAKAEMTRATRRVDEQWVNLLWDDPEELFPPAVAKRCLMTTDELAQYCFGSDPTGVTSGKKNSLGIKLNSAGFKKLELKVDGKKVRFWIINRRDDEWTPEKARAHLKTFKYPGT